MWYFRRTTMAQQTLGSDKRRLTWLVIASGVMFACAYSVARWLGVVGTISGWTGLQQHEAEIPRLRSQAEIWETLALTLPFFAAVLVWAGRQKRVSRDDVGGLLGECGVCLAASVLGTFAFLLCLFGLGMLIHKLGQ
jgi:hypothetical protein